MPRFAQYDPKAEQPAPVIGWYDTDILDYPNLPGEKELIQMTDSQWAKHFNSPNGWNVNNGKLIDPKE
jgi:hypothetical protein